MTKVCSKCKAELSIQYFHKDTSKADGYRSQCNYCSSASAKQYRENNKDKERNRYLRRKQNGCKPKIYTEKLSASSRVRYKVYIGKMEKPNRCQECNVECNTQGHHDDYSKPYDVIWLCSSCHGRRHRKYIKQAALAGKEK